MGHCWQKILAAYFASEKKNKKKKGRKLREEGDGDSDTSNENNNNAAGDRNRELALRVAADAFLFGPFCNSVAISFIALALDKKPASSIPSALKSSLPLTQLRAWRFWPLVSLVAYSKVPPKMRVPFFNCAGFLWGVILISGAVKGKGKNKMKKIG